MHVRAGLITAIYRKALRLSPAGKQRHTTGEIVNMMSVDTQKMLDLMSYLHVSWSGVLQIVVAIGFLFYFIGPATFAGESIVKNFTFNPPHSTVCSGVILLALLVPLQTKFAQLQGVYRKATLEKTDRRVKLMTEILQGMRVIKYYAWFV